MLQKKRIAILGGGAGALTAAFYLTDQPGWDQRFDITVYQMGWRLGGKGASGRNPAFGNRVEEHGLHVWYGFYENAFATIRKCYLECAERGLLQGSPMATWDAAFHPQSRVTVMDDEGGRWSRWDIPFPENPLTPGDGINLFAVWDLFVALIRQLAHHHDQTLAAAGRPIRPGGLAGLVEQTLLHAALALSERLSRDPRKHPGEAHETLIALFEHFQQQLFERFQADSVDRRVMMVLDVGTTILLGMLRENVLTDGFDPLNRYDLSEWLRKQGSKNYWCAVVRSLYTGLFAFEGGDSNRPNLAAGVALRGMLRMFLAYKGAICWKMQAGMGDTIFAPLDLLLKARGVKIAYFHKVNRLHAAADGGSIERIDMDVQAKVIPAGGYEPLYPVNGVPSWPASPFWKQLENGEQLEKQGVKLDSFWDLTKVSSFTLERGRDFDIVLLGIPAGALRYHCQELMEANPGFRGMVEQTLTVPTQAFQIWVKRSAADLGWQEPVEALMTGYVEPYDTWGDMSHLIPRETWPDGAVQNISYFCGTLRDAAIPAPESGPAFDNEQTAIAGRNADEYLDHAFGLILPGSQSITGGFNRDLLSCPSYVRANVDPPERYVLSGKGTMEYRLRPDASGFDNLYLAGDWTWSGLSAGCVESAVMSGMHAARAISGIPLAILGESDDQAEAAAAESTSRSPTSSGG